MLCLFLKHGTFFGDKIHENVLSIKADQIKETIKKKKKKENILIVKNKSLLTEVGKYCSLLKRVVSLL